jgi:hypothetical protein
MKVHYLRRAWDLSSNGTSLRVHYQKFRLVGNGHQSVTFLSKRRYDCVCGSTMNRLVSDPTLLEGRPLPIMPYVGPSLAPCTQASAVHRHGVYLLFTRIERGNIIVTNWEYYASHAISVKCCDLPKPIASPQNI